MLADASRFNSVRKLKFHGVGVFVRISVFWVLSKLVKLLMQSFHHVLYIIIINQCNTICTAFPEILTVLKR
jgi:hypothetical protein